MSKVHTENENDKNNLFSITNDNNQLINKKNELIKEYEKLKNDNSILNAKNTQLKLELFKTQTSINNLKISIDSLNNSLKRTNDSLLDKQNEYENIMKNCDKEENNINWINNYKIYTKIFGNNPWNYKDIKQYIYDNTQYLNNAINIKYDENKKSIINV